jgi:hypothetical protein
MNYYLDPDARRIRAKVTTLLGWKPALLDLFCKVTPTAGEPYFIPTRHTEEVLMAVQELGIVGQQIVLAEPAPAGTGFHFARRGGRRWGNPVKQPD